MADKIDTSPAAHERAEDGRSLNHDIAGKNGAPGAIRTPDPQIRRQSRSDVSESNSSKTGKNTPKSNQSVSRGPANRNGASDQLSLFLPTALSADEVRDKLALIDQASHLMGKRHAEALWIGLGLPAPGRASKRVNVSPHLEPEPGPLLQQVRLFTEECLNPDPLAEISAGQLYRTYIGWVEKTGRVAMHANALGKLLKRIGVKRRKSGSTVYLGFRINIQIVENPDPLSERGPLGPQMQPVGPINAGKGSGVIQ